MANAQWLTTPSLKALGISYPADGIHNGIGTWKTFTQVFFLMLNIYLPYDLPILLLGNYPGKIKQMSILRLAH